MFSCEAWIDVFSMAAWSDVFSMVIVAGLMCSPVRPGLFVLDGDCIRIDVFSCEDRID